MLPNRDYAHVDDRKIKDYLLNLDHKSGGPKAQFFRKHGFNDDNANQLKQGLLTIARTSADVKQRQTAHGVRYEIEGELLCPSGETVRVKTAWNVKEENTAPQFVTAVPGKKDKKV